MFAHVWVAGGRDGEEHFGDKRIGDVTLTWI